MLNENIGTVGEVSELMFNAKQELEAKYSHLLEGFTYAQVSEELFNAKREGN
jgi:hypothetical protein